MFVAFATNRVKDRNFCARAVREFLCRRVLVIFCSRNSSFTPILQVATKAQHLSDLNS